MLLISGISNSKSDMILNLLSKLQNETSFRSHRTSICEALLMESLKFNRAIFVLIYWNRMFLDNQIPLEIAIYHIDRLV